MMSTKGARNAAAASLLGGAYFGYNTGVVAGLSATVVMCDYFPSDPLSTHESGGQSFLKGLFTGCILGGGIFGAMLGVPFAESHGRRPAYIACGWLGLVSALQFVLDSFWLTVAVRVLMGITVGALSVIVPTYVTEMVEPNYRGSIGTFFQISICFWIFFGQLLNFAMKPDLNPDIVDKMCVETWKWKFQLGIGVLTGLAIIVHGHFFLPESDDWLMRQGKLTEEDDETYAMCRPSWDEYMEEMDDDSDLPAPLLVRAPSVRMPRRGGIQTYSWFELFTTRSGLKWVGIGMGLACSAQLTGINALMFYSPQIFKDAGFENVLILTVIVIGLWNFVSVFAALSLVDKLGRRPLMLTALMGMTSSSFLLSASYIILPADSSMNTFVTVAALMGFIFFFEVGPGSLFFLMASETFPRVVRSKALVFTNVCNWTFNIVVSTGFPVLINFIGSAMTFLLLALIGAGSTLFIYKKLPETKGDLPPTPLIGSLD